MRGSENEYVAHVLELLRRWAPVAARRMFGGYGIYRGDIMFALIADDTLHFKTDAGNRADYEAAGMAPFSYARAGRPAVSMSYHAVPPDLLETGDELGAWAEQAFAAALRARRTTKPTRKIRRPAASG
jgi:DNA transformation protein and related proteins